METDANSLAHSGRKGMKWGVRRSDKELASNTPPQHSEDAQRHNEIKLKVSAAGGVHALSNEEFKSFLDRAQMEQRYSDLVSKQSSKTTITKGHDAIKNALGFVDTGVRIYNLATSPAAKAAVSAVKAAKA